MYCFYKKSHSNEHNERVWDNEWEGQVVLRHISTACGGGGGTLFSRSFTPMSVAVKHVIKERCPLVKACLYWRTLVFLYMSASINRPERKSFLEKVRTRLNCFGLEDFFNLGWGF